MVRSETLTSKQKKVYNFIKQKLDEKGESPTISEIAAFIKASSLRAVTQYLETLHKKGFIKRNRYTQRGIELAENDGSELVTIPVFASAGCGQPSIMAEQSFNEYATVDAGLLGNKRDNLFVIRAIGGSMEDAGVMDNDLVLVERTEDVINNDLVVAIIDNTAVIKKITFANNATILSPVSTDSSYRPIIMRKDFAIFGKVINVLKTSHSTEYRYIPLEEKYE